MSTTNPIGQTGNTQDTTPSSSTRADGTDGLGRDAFLQLLVTQLQHQDPTQPQDDGQFIAQLAQFSSLEQLTNIDSTLKGMADAMGVVLPEKKSA